MKHHTHKKQQVRDKKTARITDVVELSLPPMEYNTAALWTELPGTDFVFSFVCMCVDMCVTQWMYTHMAFITPPIPSYTPLQARSNAASAPSAGSRRGPISTGIIGAYTPSSTCSSRWPPWSYPATLGT
jgi:hypothetical protein